MQACIWCERKFNPRENGEANHYSLISAGTMICWRCSDLYEETEIKMHIGSLKAKVNRHLALVTTENNHRLPLTIQSWVDSRLPWVAPIARAVDNYGQHWSIHNDQGYAKLKPIAS